MNRELWFRLLQVAVVAPYVYTLSEKQDGYFKLGLKLVAAAVLIRNIEPIARELAPLIQAAANMQAEKERLADQANPDVIEGDFTETTG